MHAPRRSAIQSGIQTLCHYEPFKPEYLLGILRDKKVYCSDMSALNDPWDRRPWFDSDNIHDPKAVDELVEWIFSLELTRPVGDQEKRATAHQLRTKSSYRRNVLTQYSQGFLTIIPRRWRNQLA